MCQACVRSVVLYDSEVTCDRHVSEVLYSMVMRWQVTGRCVGVLFSIIVRWQVSGVWQECFSL